MSQTSSSSIKTITNRPQRLEGYTELQKTSVKLFANARRLIQIYSHDLDPQILNNRSAEKQLLDLVKQGRHSRIEILIHAEERLKGFDHRLVSLAQRFTSSIGIRLIPKDYFEEAFAFYLVDKRHMLLRTNHRDYHAELRQMPDALIKDKGRLFDKIWQESSPASFLRALHL